MSTDCSCPLCGTAAPLAVVLPQRTIHACPRCDLRFVPVTAHLSPEQEVARYRLHRNSVEDEGYVRFLQPVVDCLKRILPEGATVLDYGSGPTAVLVELLTRAGFHTVAYDPFFAPEPDLTVPFDAIVSTETFEHFRRPAVELDRIRTWLRPGGFLAVMTTWWTPGRDFRTWHYAADDTHIAFYSETAFRYLAAAWGFGVIETNGKDLVVLAKG